MSADILPFVSPSVVAIDHLAAEQSAARLGRTPLGDLRGSMKYCDIVKLANRAFRAAESTDIGESERARAMLRHIREYCAYPQGRSLAAMFLRILERPQQ